jgi:hypothetical protein
MGLHKFDIKEAKHDLTHIENNSTMGRRLRSEIIRNINYYQIEYGNFPHVFINLLLTGYFDDTFSYYQITDENEMLIGKLMGTNGISYEFYCNFNSKL